MRIRLHYVSDIKRIFLSLLKLDRLSSPEEIEKQVYNLLESDQFLCPEENYEVCKEVQGAFVRANKPSGMSTTIFRSSYCQNNVQELF